MDGRPNFAESVKSEALPSDWDNSDDSDGLDWDDDSADARSLEFHIDASDGNLRLVESINRGSGTVGESGLEVSTLQEMHAWVRS